MNAPQPRRLTLTELDKLLRQGSFDVGQSVSEARAAYEAGVLQPLPDDVRATDVRLGRVPALELRVDGAPTGRVILYFHGGGYVVGSARTGAHLAAELGRRANAVAYSVEYRRAPEHRHSQAVTGALNTYAAVLRAGIPPDHIGLAGDSAGGGLVVALLLAARERELAMPACAVVFSPWVDLTCSGASMDTKDGIDPIFDRESVQWFVDHVMTDEADLTSASPIFASMLGLPPFLIQAGSHEILLDDATRLAAALARDEVTVSLDVLARAPHVFQGWFRELAEGDAALTQAGDFIRRHTTATPLASFDLNRT